MRDLRIGAALAVTFASLLAASIAFAQQPVNPVPPTWVVLSELPDDLTVEIPFIRNFKVVVNENKVLLLDPTGRAVAPVAPVVPVVDECSTGEIKK